MAASNAFWIQKLLATFQGVVPLYTTIEITTGKMFLSVSGDKGLNDGMGNTCH
jgi:hypothetical protein